MNRILRIALPVALLAVLAAGVLLAQAPPAAKAAGVYPGQTVPDFSLPPVGGGKAMSLSAFKGKPVVVVFWATWCGPCRNEIPALKELYQRYTAKGVQVITVTLDSRQSQEDVIRFKQAKELPYLILWDKENKVTDAWEVEGIPTNLVIDKKGVVAYRGHGLDQELVAALEATLKN